MAKHITKKAAHQLKTGKVKFASLGDNDSTTPIVGEYEEVVHPKHYNHLPNGIECWDVTEHFPTNIGSAMKYLWRVGLKPGQDSVKDLKKVIQYVQRQIDLIEGKNKSMK